MPSAILFRFGAELEVVTGSREHAHMDWHLVSRELSGKLAAVGIKNHVNANHDKAVEDYSEWSIIQEVTITNQMMQNRWGMELVSPVCNFQRPEIWRSELDSIWWVLDHQFQTTSNEQCSTHVHISPVEGQWSLSQVKKVAKAVVYFERSIDSLLPQDRRQNVWCQSNRWNHSLKSQSMATIFGWIDSMQSIAHVAFLMCTRSKDSDYGKMAGKKHDFAHNTFRWNFVPLTEGSKGTIEFRQAPGSRGAADTQCWIEFTAAFVQGANQYADKLDPMEPPTLELLRELVVKGAQISGIKDWSPLDRLFYGRTQLTPGAYNLSTISANDLEKMKQKAKESNITIAKFKKLYGYK